MGLITLLIVVGLIAFVLWIIGITTHALPPALVQACLVLWIVALVIYVVLAVTGHGGVYIRM
jgi:hypothetical protein